MPVVSKLQSGFTSGELDPKLRARNDVAAYYNGAAKLRNVLVIPQGAAKRRPGMEYMRKLPTGPIQLIPFVYSDTEHYLCVLTENLLSIFKAGQLMDTVICSISSTQIIDVTWAQSYDTLIIFNKGFAPQAFIRATETSWSNQAWVLLNIPTRNFGDPENLTLKVNNGAAIPQPVDFGGWVTGNTITDAGFVSSGSSFVIGDVGKHIRAGGGYALITDYVDASNVKGTVLTPFKNDPEGTDADDTTVYDVKEWGIEEPSWSATRGYPSCGAFFQGRLYMANTTDLPNTLWGSLVNNENDFQNWLPAYADNGVEVSAGGGLVSTFHRIHSGQHLVVLADNGEFYIPSSKQEPITPLNISLVRNSSFGSVNLPTFEIDGAVVYLRAGGRALIEAKFNFADGSYINKDLSLLSSHLLNNPRAIAYRKQTSTDEAEYIMVVNGDGTLSVLCTLRVQEVTAWTVSETEGSFVSCAVDGTDMYFVIDRTIDGIPVRTLERFRDELLVDCAKLNETDLLTYGGTQLTYDNLNLTYRSIGVSALTDLDYLNGQEVAIVMDNTVQPSQTVEGGQVTLDRVGDDVQAGLEFPIVDVATGSHVYIETMPIEVDLADGSSVGKRKRVIEATVMLYETSHVEVRKNKIPIRRIGIDHLDTPVPKRSENLTISGLLGWDDEINISIGQTIPLPMQLLGLAYKVRV